MARSFALLRTTSSLTFAAAIFSESCARATVAPAPDSVVAFFSSVSQSATNMRKSRVSWSRSGATALPICEMLPPFPCEATVSALFSMAISFSAFRQRQQEGYQRNDQKDDKQNLRNAGGAGGNATEAEQCRDQCDDEKYDGVIQHF